MGKEAGGQKDPGQPRGLRSLQGDGGAEEQGGGGQGQGGRAQEVERFLMRNREGVYVVRKLFFGIAGLLPFMRYPSAWRSGPEPLFSKKTLASI